VTIAPGADVLSAAGGHARPEPEAEAVEVAVAVHAVNQAREVARVLDAAAAGLESRWAGRAAVLAADGGSQDATAEVLRRWCESAPAPVRRRVIDAGAPASRGRAVLALLDAAQSLGARAVALVDADLTGFRAEWVGALVGPVLRGEAEYVSPAYDRAISEGTLTVNLLAPLTGALYGARLQQVMGGCAGLAGRLPGEWIAAAAHAADWQPHGAELWLTTAALAGRVRLAEVALGRKIATAAAPTPDLATTLARTVGPLFALMEPYQAAWQESTDAPPVQRSGPGPAVLADGAAGASVEQMVRAFDIGLKDLLPVWEQIMAEPTLARLYPLALSPDEFRFPPALWARVVADFAVAHHERRLPREHLLRSLTPLYLGRVAGFIREARGASPAGVAAIVESIDRAFEAEKDYLVARWR